SSSVIIDLEAGRLTFLNHKDKKHASITIEEIIKMRDAQIAQIKAQLPSMPPEVKKQMEDQIKLMEGGEKSADLDVKTTGKKDKVNGYDCEVFKWTGSDGGGEACIATKITGVDPSGFKKMTE